MTVPKGQREWIASGGCGFTDAEGSFCRHRAGHEGPHEPVDHATLASFMAGESERTREREGDSAAGCAAGIRLAFGVIAAVIFVLAGVAFFGAGAAMQIESVGGRTLEEAFYQASGILAFGLGLFAFAMAALSLAVGIQTTRR